ncbi:MAG: hypothetical protein WCX84_04445 [Syntrophales bacterium]
METLSKDDLNALITKHKDLCISIYMPTHRSGVETQQNQIRFKNLLREAEERLVSSGMKSQDARNFLEKAYGLVNNVLFWRQQRDSLAFFLSSDLFLHYTLPVSMTELVVVTDRFHLKPLLPLLFRDERFYILALSQNEVTFYEGSSLNIHEIEINGLPQGINQALQGDEPKKQVRFRSRGGVSERGSMISGHGPDIEDTKDNLLRYFRQVDRLLKDTLKDERPPLILAGVDFLLPIYREVNTYPDLYEEAITGNPKRLSRESLRKKGWSLVNRRHEVEIENVIDLYRQSQGTGLTASDIGEILVAAHQGRIGMLFVPLGEERWGTFNSDTGQVTFSETAVTGDEDLFDLAALLTYLNGGDVFALPPERIPEDSTIAALFRY